MNKICTSIEQSKKLAKILPSESADMVYQSIEDEYGDGEWESIPRNHSLNIGYDNDVPCWSLVALISLLPKHYCLETLDDGTYVCYNFLSQHEKFGNTPIDAVYSMIVFLKEEKII